jgi:hypothetical protein
MSLFSDLIMLNLTDRNVHILGSVQNIKIARDAVVSLILGSPPGMSPLNLQGDANVDRKGLRSFEICWSEAQAAILEFCWSCWLDLCVLIFGFSACSNDYLHDDARSLGLYHLHIGGLCTELCMDTSHQRCSCDQDRRHACMHSYIEQCNHLYIPLPCSICATNFLIPSLTRLSIE